MQDSTCEIMNVGYTKYTLIRFSKKKKYTLINVREQVS